MTAVTAATTTAAAAAATSSTPMLRRRCTLWIVAIVATWNQKGLVADAFSPVSLQHTSTTRARNIGIYLSATKNDSNGDWFQQKPGESDVAFIKRITSAAPPPTSTKKPEPEQQQEEQEAKGGYQRIEDWEAEQQQARKDGTLTWEEKVQFDGQRFGNQIRQNDILMRQINSGL